MYDHRDWRRGSALRQMVFWLHALLIPLGLFFCVAGTYATVVQIKEAYASGQIGKSMVEAGHIIRQALTPKQVAHSLVQTTPTLHSIP